VVSVEIIFSTPFFFSITALFPLVFGVVWCDVVWFQLRLSLVRRSFFSITALFPMVFGVVWCGLVWCGVVSVEIIFSSMCFPFQLRLFLVRRASHFS
jgi:hypothetical protein